MASAVFGEPLRKQLACTMPVQPAGLHRAASAWFARATSRLKPISASSPAWLRC